MAKTPEELLAEQEAAKVAAQTQDPAVAAVPDPAGTPPAQPEVAVAEPGVPAQTEQVTVEVQGDAPVAPVIDPVTGLPVEQPRKTAEDKRKEIELAKFDDEELLEMLIARMETADTMKERITQLVAGANQVMEENPELQGEGAPVEGQEEDPEAPFAKKEEDEEATKAPANAEEQPVPAKEDAAPEAPATEEPAKVPAQEETPAVPPVAETEEERRKKKQIQSYELDMAKMAKDLMDLQTEFNNLKDEATTLREFKANIDNKEKEEVLATFALLDEDFKTTLRSEFSLLSREELESKCALAYYRKGLMHSGQNTQSSDALVSYTLEDEKSSLPGWVTAIKSAKK